MLLIILLHVVTSTPIQLPPFWRNKECNQDSPLLEEAPLPRPYGTYGDQFDPDSGNYLLRNTVDRRVHYGANNDDTGYPWTSICSISEKNDKFHWCTCTILTEIWVITARLCFRTRPYTEKTTMNIPPIKVTYGSTRKSTHKNTRFVVEMIFHPNIRVDVMLLRLNEPILFTQDLVPFSPDRWMMTTGWRNLLPKCSTLMCGYGVTENGATDNLKCNFYGFTTNLGTFLTHRVPFDERYYSRNFTRLWLGSMNDHASKFKTWVDNKGKMDGHYATACTGDPGAPLILYDRPGYFLIGIVTGTRRFNHCGEFGVDIAVSMIALLGWLTEYIDGITYPVASIHKDLNGGIKIGW